MPTYSQCHSATGVLQTAIWLCMRQYCRFVARVYSIAIMARMMRTKVARMVTATVTRVARTAKAAKARAMMVARVPL